MKNRLLFIIFVYSLFLISCKKNEVPTLTTISVVDSTFTSIVSGGEISSNGGSDIIAKGVCWNTTGEPTINDQKTIDGSGSANFESYISGLESGENYFIRAYAINEVGVGYGDVISFKTLDNTVTDVDGNTYNIVKIGTQIWMAENLKTTKYNDGTSINFTSSGYEWLSQTSGAYCWMQDDSYYKNIYGAYYNWYAVNTGKLAPKGWHVPTETEWLTLINYLGGTSVAGGKMKQTGTSLWYYPNTGATNEIGFTALPAGYRSSKNGSNPSVGEYALFWCSTKTSSGAGRVMIGYNGASVDYDYEVDIIGFCVRCIKD